LTNGASAIASANHGRSPRERDLRDFGDWNLRARRRANQHPAQLFHVVPKVAVVPDIHRIPLAALYVFSDHLAADSRSNCLLHVSDRQPVASRFCPAHFDVEIKTLRNAFGKNGTRFRNP
jgi:hypothetical protein